MHERGALVTWFLGCLVLLGSAPAGAQGQTPGNWLRFSSPQGYVAVSFPASPDFKRRVSDTIVGDVETEIWSVRTDLGDFALTYSHLPALARFFSSRSMLYGKASERMLEEMQATLIDSGPIDDPFWQYELTYQVAGNPSDDVRIGRARFRYIDGMVVTVTAVVPVARQAPARRYLRSVEPQPDS